MMLESQNDPLSHGYEIDTEYKGHCMSILTYYELSPCGLQYGHSNQFLHHVASKVIL